MSIFLLTQMTELQILCLTNREGANNQSDQETIFLTKKQRSAVAQRRIAPFKSTSSPSQPQDTFHAHLFNLSSFPKHLQGFETRTVYLRLYPVEEIEKAINSQSQPLRRQDYHISLQAQKTSVRRYPHSALIINIITDRVLSPFLPDQDLSP